ncbi:hypothetical protein C8J56DRAFT_859393 [Mycena floridula]|nr:hypothetical protein C8J56DRAFT_859393 [Mycena floridula]
MTYDFMDREVESCNIPFPPFSVAKLRPRFVECGVALAMQSGTLGGSFLVEEEIQGKFMKYVLNSHAVPIMRPRDQGYDIATFLCFCQHVQYLKTGGLAYISDYQGAGDLLTNLQIMTSNSLKIKICFLGMETL